MAIGSSITQTAAFKEAYGRVDAALKVRQAKIYVMLCLVLVPACVGLDYFVYPHMLGRIFVARVICDLVHVPCLLALFTARGQKYAGLLCKLVPLPPSIIICWMIYASEGVFSPYYAGINLCLVGVILLIPYTLTEAGLICALVVFFYTAACAAHNFYPPATRLHVAATLHPRSVFINNIYFLGVTTVIALCACHYTYLKRIEEFRLRYELDANNRELATTLKKLQETEVQLVQSEKMNALGKLSAGLLHEINNPLNFTFMALQIARQDAEGNEALTDTLKDIGEGMERIRTVIADLRAFAYPSQQQDMQDVAVDEVLTSAIRLTTHELGDITIDRSAAAGVRAMANNTQIVHVLMNFLVNSAHAIKAKSPAEGGKIIVRCEQVDGRTHVIVRDNGSGIAPENMQKILDPFFTTKAPGKGMGLGLSICHTIVKNHGGEIRVKSELGQWTEISFDLAPAPVALRSAA